VPIDRPDEDDSPAKARASVDVAEPRVPAETRDPATYYVELQATVAAERWEAASARFTKRWAEHQSRWPSNIEQASRTTPEKPDGEQADGTWRGNGGRTLDSTANAEANRACERIRDIEQRVITPAMREIEAEDPDRTMAGLDHRVKGPDRLKDKAAKTLKEQPEITASQALSLIPDAIRFTYCYTDQHYATGVRSDLDRLHARGFELTKLKNSWESDQYKGINSQWREPETGQRFEVQFHTETSFKAKQVTHGAYERIRNPDTTDAELDELEDLQRSMYAGISVPRDATEIDDYPRKEHHG
jgi:hypothetical protein